MSGEPRFKSTRLPDTEEELEELRQRVRDEHAAYMRKWEGWKPDRRPTPRD